MPCKTWKPPFLFGHRHVALTFVAGRYEPLARKRFPAGSLAIYMSKAQPRLFFQIWGRSHERYLFSVADDNGYNIERVLIEAWLRFQVPFDQWRIPVLGDPERLILRKLRLLRHYEQVLKPLARVVYEARSSAYWTPPKSWPKSRPWFAVHPRSAAAISNDLEERKAISDLLGLPRRFTSSSPGERQNYL